MKTQSTKNHKELYLPTRVKVLDVIDITSDVKLFKLERPRGFYYSPGQFLMASVWGAGEVPISITSTYEIHKDLELCIRKVGHVTTVLHHIKPDDNIGIRGPFGNRFPFEDALGKDILFVAGGIGIAPLRSLINLIVDQKKKFGKIALVYGSRNPSEVLFMSEILRWEKEGVEVTLTIDVKCDGWQCSFGLVTEHLSRQRISFKTGYSYICGPHVMIKTAMRDLALMGMREENIVTTLEAHMKCGVGKCGHCYAASKYICTDGPVFSLREIKQYNLSSP